jgi:hypothetical protein
MGQGSRLRTMMRTHRLELDDQTLREWDAVVAAAAPDKGKGFRRLRIAIGG